MCRTVDHVNVWAMCRGVQDFATGKNFSFNHS